ncbi:aminodeoxychorismate synthase [Chloropicon primus]|uniref:aminodeoxychorismate synthase n=1 Tax=Chloropicon primus TaxID=1764295 RepID=A0A5B8MGT4_9CHLO|nr:aminodeoxychorismate synthase [Chloropicon primus]UPQ98103.1 aminodeoxychorismate synthase [Chloropicon primus]|eukprot:QDZ18895.1 aminodeoxychorismate synthase [Chloropicon primus]
MGRSRACRVLLVDNYDSYTYNLYQMLSVVHVEGTSVEVDVMKNDAVPFSRLRPSIIEYDAIVLSPGPGTPECEQDVGVCRDILDHLVDVPILGVCLGHQALAHAYGAKVVKAPVPFHGRLSRVTTTCSSDDEVGRGSELFAGIPSDGGFDVVRYHSLVVDEASLPDCLLPLAWTSPDEESKGRRLLMAIMHRDYPHYGVQFHPESICTSHGATLLKNFVGMALKGVGTQARRSCLGLESGNGSEAVVPGVCRPSEGRVERGEPCARIHRGIADGGLWINALALKSEERIDAEKMFLDCCFGGGGEQGSQDTFWLDSSNLDYSGARFSYMGRRGGKFWRRIEYVLGDQSELLGTMKIGDTEGGEEVLTFRKEDGITFWDCMDGMVQETSKRMSDQGAHFICGGDGELGTLPSGWSLKNDGGAAEGDPLPFDFQCGFVGYIGYEMKAQCGGSMKHEASHPDSFFFFADQVIAIDHDDGTIYFLELSEHKLDGPSSWMKGALASMTGDSLAGVDPGSGGLPCDKNLKESAEWSRIHEEYVGDIGSCKEYLLDGDSYEICLTNRLKIEGEFQNALDYYRLLRQRNPAPYSAFLDFTSRAPDQKTGLTICCSSPERFLKLTRAGVLEAKPIKGTIRRGRTKDEDAEALNTLRCSGKDRAENLMIVDLLRNDLGRVSELGSVHVPKLMDVESYATVHQMVSTVRGQKAQGVTPVDCIRCAFPAGSMTGAPKIRTMQIIDDLEMESRGVYSGTIGYISCRDGCFDMNVVIRTAIFSGTGTIVGAGGAITIQSNAESEFDEIVVKAEVLVSTPSSRGQP